MATRIITGMISAIALTTAMAMADERVDEQVFEQVSVLQITSLSETNNALYRSVVGNARLYGANAVRQEHGYVIESGTYRSADGSLGSIVMVRSSEEQITAIVDMPGQQGVFFGGTARGLRFVPLEHSAFDDVEDAVATDMDEPVRASDQTLTVNNIDVGVAFSTYALGKLDEKAGGELDPIAYALAQLETANLGLRNSKVADTSLRLGAVNIFNTDGSYNTTGAGLSKWQKLMNRYRSVYKTDMNAAITGSGSGPNGMAYVGGYTSANAWFAPAAYRHEVGHNAGGSHCNSGQASYKFGYSNGPSKTFLCGNKVPYYSTPDVTDNRGFPLGNKDTADMARLWRERATKMAGYHPELPGTRLLFTSPNKAHSVTVRLETETVSPRAGIVALSPHVGPTKLEPLPVGGYSVLNIELSDLNGQKRVLKFRGARNISSCPWGAMNRNTGCQASTPLRFKLAYDPADNPDLPEGTYNGMTSFEARDASDPKWVVPIHAIISIYHTSVLDNNEKQL
jgi:hypothetical protein